MSRRVFLWEASHEAELLPGLWALLSGLGRCVVVIAADPEAAVLVTVWPRRNSLVGDWTEDANVGLMAYGHRRQGDSGDIEVMIAPGPFERTKFTQAIASVSPTGKTPLTHAVENAAEALAFRDNPATVVIVTDGIESCQRDPCALAKDLERMGVGFTAHVIGFDLDGEEQDAVACMAEHTGGRFVAAGNAEELDLALSEVATAVAEVVTGKPEPVTEHELKPAATEQDVTLEAPGSATMGADFDVAWEKADQQTRDYVTIVPLGTEEGEYGDYMRVGDDTEGTLQAPAEPGLYEVRYVLNEGGRTLGSVEIEIVQAEVSIQAPEHAVVGSSFAVSWSQPIHPRDYVTIVPVGTKEGEYGNYMRVGEVTEGTLQAPAKPGRHEVRYVLEEGGGTLASVGLEIFEAGIELTGPDTVRAGSDIRVAWSGTAPHPRDYVTIVPMGAEEGAYTDYMRVGSDTEAEVNAPDETGFYELRYVLEEGRRTLARHLVEVVAADAALNDGGALVAPQTGAPGETVEIGWSANGDGNRRVALAAADQADFTWIDAQEATGDALSFTLPDEPGSYEFRLLDIGKRAVLSRVTIAVE